MNKQTTARKVQTTTIGSRSRRILMASASAVIIGAMSLAGISYAADNQAAPAKVEKHERHNGKAGKMTPEHAEKRFDRMLNRLVPDASADQKTRLGVIAKAAFADLQPLRQQGRDLHAQRNKLLSAATIDRNALEQLRVTEQKLADQRSRRVTQAFADAAEVLTPAQRVKAVETMQKHKRGFGHGFEHGSRSHHGHGHKPGSDAAKAQQ